MEQGFYTVENDKYHSGPGVSSSELKKVLSSPADCKVKTETTAAMEFGSMVHAFILEPEVFNSQYSVAPPDYNPRTNAGKQFKKDLLSAGTRLVSQSEFETISNIKKSIEANATASHLLWGTDGVNEMAGYWNDPETNILCKAKPDRRVDSKQYIIDLKTTSNATQEEFNRSIYTFQYYLSAAHYLNGVSEITGEEWETFICIAVEKTPPFKVGVYPLSDSWIFLGREKVQQAIQIYSECLKTDTWPGLPDKAISLKPEHWMLKKILPYGNI